MRPIQSRPFSGLSSVLVLDPLSGIPEALDFSLIGRVPFAYPCIEEFEHEGRATLSSHFLARDAFDHRDDVALKFHIREGEPLEYEILV